MIALACYRRHPGRVASLLLADTYRGGGTLPEPERSQRLARRLEVTESLSPAQLARERAPALFTAGADAALLAEARSIMAEIHPVGYRQAAIALANADETATLPRIAVPTLVLCGDQDGVLPLPESETLAREIPCGAARRHPERRPRQQPGTAGRLQRRRAVLPRGPAGRGERTRLK